MERTYTIPLRRTFMKTSHYLRTNRAVRHVREYLQKHMKTENVKLGEELNSKLWARGDSYPPHKVTVVVRKEDDVVYAELQGHEFKKKDFSAQEEKKETRGFGPTAGTPAEQKSAEEIVGEAATAKAKAETKETKAKPAAKKAAKK